MNARSLALTAAMTGIIAALGIMPPIPAPMIPVPITLQAAGPILAGMLLGPRRGTASVLLLLVLAAIGLPVLTGGRGGLGVFAGPTAGYLVGYVIAAYVTGLIVQFARARVAARARARSEKQVKRGEAFRELLWYILAGAVGVLIMYVTGTVGMVLILRMEWVAAFVANGIFVPFDAVKAVLAAMIARGVHRVMPDLFENVKQSSAKAPAAATPAATAAPGTSGLAHESGQKQENGQAQ